MGRVDGKVAIVAGGAGGIGSATARALAREGARVTIADLADSQGTAVAREIGCDFLALDVTREDEWAGAVAAVDRKHGGIDVLVNAAGIEGNLENANPEMTSLAEWHRVHAVNLDGVFLGCRAVLPIMKRAGKGSIVNISSIVSYMGTPASVPYGSSKAAVQQLTKSVAVYGSRESMRIRCNSIHPGVIRTRMVRDIYAAFARTTGMTVAQAEENSLRKVPFGELGEPEDVANFALFLASDESKYATGSEFQVDGGWHLVDAR